MFQYSKYLNVMIVIGIDMNFFLQSRYDVSFNPDRPKKMLPDIFQRVKDKFFPKELIAFDQMKNCYSLNPLKNVPSSDRFTTTVSIYILNRCDF